VAPLYNDAFDENELNSYGLNNRQLKCAKFVVTFI